MERRNLGKTPLSESRPAGQEVREDGLFEGLSQEIEKMSSATQSGTVDWRRVLQLSEEILANKSKDLLVLAYFSVAMLKIHGLRGLAESVNVLRDALETYWEDMFPAKKRMRGRKNALEWWQEKVSFYLNDITPEKWPPEDRDSFLADFEAVNAFLGEHMEDAPLLYALISTASALVETEAPAAVPPSPEGAPGLKEKTTSTANRNALPPPSVDLNGTDADKLINQGLEALGRAAAILGKGDPFNALAFRLNRIAAWASVTNPPPAVAGKTLLPAPDGQIVAALENLYQARSWPDLLAAAESRVRQFLFWIDLSRYAAEALEQLGRREESELVAEETYRYVHRLPGVDRLAFENGMPFANEDTKNWLRLLEQKISPQPRPKEGEETDIRQVVERQIAAAYEANRENRLPAALAAFTTKLTHASSARERFLWQLGLCRLLLQIKQPRLAAPHLKDMLQIVDTYRLEVWEPDLAVEALATIVSGLRAQAGAGEEGLEEAVLNRITTLDPVKAMEFF